MPDEPHGLLHSNHNDFIGFAVLLLRNGLRLQHVLGLTLKSSSLSFPSAGIIGVLITPSFPVFYVVSKAVRKCSQNNTK